MNIQLTAYKQKRYLSSYNFLGSIYLQIYVFKVIHRPKKQKLHVDALISVQKHSSIRNTFEQALPIKQLTDPDIVLIPKKLLNLNKYHSMNYVMVYLTIKMVEDYYFMGLMS